jgi:hypothetical protein
MDKETEVKLKMLVLEIAHKLVREANYKSSSNPYTVEQVKKFFDDLYNHIYRV